MKRKIINLSESDLHRIVKESVKRVIKEDTESIKNQFANIITGIDENSALFIAGELARAGEDTLKTMEFIINHMNGYGYDGPDVNGNYNY